MEKSCNLETIMKQLRTAISSITYKFHPNLVNWLPENKHVQVHVRPFLEAVKSLLTNSKLVKQENLSLPHPDTPFLGLLILR